MCPPPLVVMIIDFILLCIYYDWLHTKLLLPAAPCAWSLSSPRLCIFLLSAAAFSYIPTCYDTPTSLYPFPPGIIIISSKWPFSSLCNYSPSWLALMLHDAPHGSSDSPIPEKCLIAVQSVVRSALEARMFTGDWHSWIFRHTLRFPSLRVDRITQIQWIPEGGFRSPLRIRYCTYSRDLSNNVIETGRSNHSRREFNVKDGFSNWQPMPGNWDVGACPRALRELWIWGSPESLR